MRIPLVALVLAGGRGSRLSPLTDHQPKPAVAFAGSYRLIDVTLSNLTHSGIRNVWIAEQYRPNFLNRYLAGGRPWDLDGTLEGLRVLPPGEGDTEDGFSEGNGHALFQHLDEVEAVGAQTLVVFSADHLCQIDMREVLAQHERLGSDVTVVTTEVVEDPSRYGVIQTKGDVVTEYAYKPKSPKGQVIATEVFVFKVAALRAACDALVAEGSDGAELGDYGETILPFMVENATVHAYRSDGYWRDIGTIDAYFQAHMELIDGTGFNLYDPAWPVLSNLATSTPARIRPEADVDNSLICPGADVAGRITHSLIGPWVRVERGATVNRCVLTADVVVPAGAHLESVIADTGAEVKPGRTGVTKPGPGNITVLTAAGGGSSGSSGSGDGSREPQL